MSKQWYWCPLGGRYEATCSFGSSIVDNDGCFDLVNNGRYPDGGLPNDLVHVLFRGLEHDFKESGFLNCYIENFEYETASRLTSERKFHLYAVIKKGQMHAT